MKILFVCTGNTCRSAMAEAFAKDLIQKKALNISVCSAGTYANTGEHASYNSIVAMKDYDIDLTLHTSTSIYDTNISEVDYIFCATNSHKLTIKALYPDKKNIYTMKEYSGFCQTENDIDISDPWGNDINSYRLCCAEISICIERIINKLITTMKG